LRSDSGSVSGIRTAFQTSATMPYSNSTTKMSRHWPNTSTAWPSDGAITGTAMNTIIASDITLAMRRPA
jgi:hypothetical protein